MTTILKYTNEHKAKIKEYKTKISILESLMEWLDNIAAPAAQSTYGSVVHLESLANFAMQLKQVNLSSLDQVFDPLDYVNNPNARAKTILSLCEKLELNINEKNSDSLMTTLFHRIACDLQQGAQIQVDVVTDLQKFVSSQISGYQAIVAALTIDTDVFEIAAPKPAKKSTLSCFQRYLCCCFFSNNEQSGATNEEKQTLLRATKQ